MAPDPEKLELSTEDVEFVTGLRPGIKDSTILTLDSALTLMRLFKSEAAQALGSLPSLLGLSLARGPIYLLTWLSFSIFAASVAYMLSGNLVFGTGAFFLLQLAAAVVLELKIRRLHDRIDFPQSRKGLAILQAGLKQRLRREQAS